MNVQADYLLLGARPLNGDTLATPQLRPISFAPPLVRAGSSLPALTTTASSLVGSWSSTCEYGTPFNATTGLPSSYRTGSMTIWDNGTWTAMFTYYAGNDSACMGAPTFTFPIAPISWNTTGPNELMYNVLDMTFGITPGVFEYDVAFQVGDYVALGARPLDGSFLDSPSKRPHSLSPLWVRVDEASLASDPSSGVDMNALAGDWESPTCEYAYPVSSGLRFKRYFTISVNGLYANWTGTFKVYNDATCTILNSTMHLKGPLVLTGRAVHMVCTDHHPPTHQLKHD